MIPTDTLRHMHVYTDSPHRARRVHPWRYRSSLIGSQKVLKGCLFILSSWKLCGFVFRWITVFFFILLKLSHLVRWALKRVCGSWCDPHYRQVWWWWWWWWWWCENHPCLMWLCVPPPGAVRGADCQDLHKASVIDCCEDTAAVCDDLKSSDSWVLYAAHHLGS